MKVILRMISLKVRGKTVYSVNICIGMNYLFICVSEIIKKFHDNTYSSSVDLF